MYPRRIGRPLPPPFADGLAEGDCVDASARFLVGFRCLSRAKAGIGRGFGAKIWFPPGFPPSRGLIPSGGHIPKELFPVSAATSPSSLRDRYRFPQICPVLPARRLKRTENICFNHCVIVGSCNPSADLIWNDSRSSLSRSPRSSKAKRFRASPNTR
jgi:hypothetical protein